ncbi:transcriptional repressor LexA [Companilactobacillus zhongbaensis]|uniref:transcriptional repressor LexA n=1 Tax=Companilactobacillus zhongbaensis TaxID=2486009 RepID=UPI000F798702|nr:transcriptional repressor LexA [Companilactobacillus zhongbaensis]
MSKNEGSKQTQILECIHDYLDEHGYPPTVREICEAVDLSSTSTVHGHLSRLEKKGYIQRDPTKPRALELTIAGLNLIGIKPKEIPIIGTVAAGQPITAEQDFDGTFPLPPDLSRDSGELFMLKIHGESMINIGILDGDQVIVHEQNTANNGEIVIAMTEEIEATCKRFYAENGHYRLQPENDTMDPIILDNVEIVGKVVGLYRPQIF